MFSLIDHTVVKYNKQTSALRQASEE